MKVAPWRRGVDLHNCAHAWTRCSTTKRGSTSIKAPTKLQASSRTRSSALAPCIPSFQRQIRSCPSSSNIHRL